MRRVLSPEEKRRKALEAKLEQKKLELLAVADALGLQLFIADFDSAGKLDSCSSSLALPGMYSDTVLDHGVKAKLEASAVNSGQFFASMSRAMIPKATRTKILRQTVRDIRWRTEWAGPKVTRGEDNKSVAIDDMSADECLTLIKVYRGENVKLPLGIAELYRGSGAPIDFAIEEGRKKFCKKEIYKSSGLHKILELPYDPAKDGRSKPSEETSQKRKEHIGEINAGRAAKKKSRVDGAEDEPGRGEDSEQGVVGRSRTVEGDNLNRRDDDDEEDGLERGADVQGRKDGVEGVFGGGEDGDDEDRGGGAGGEGGEDRLVGGGQGGSGGTTVGGDGGGSITRPYYNTDLKGGGRLGEASADDGDAQSVISALALLEAHNGIDSKNKRRKAKGSKAKGSKK